MIYDDDTRAQGRARVVGLRQQVERKETQSHMCLSDFITDEKSGVADYIGAFAVTAGSGLEDLVARYEAENDTYRSMMAKAVADRFAEAFAEYLHAQVRKKYWGYATDEGLDNDALIAEKYQGIRPAPGYPANPDHTQKTLLWDLMDVEKNTGIKLTESLAMWPASSVSGWYFSHPDSDYFGIHAIDRDQLADYAERKGIDIAEAEKWLAPLLG